MSVWLKQKLFSSKIYCREHYRIFRLRWESHLLFTENFPRLSFDHAAILTMDRVGEWATTSMALDANDDRVDTLTVKSMASRDQLQLIVWPLCDRRVPMMASLMTDLKTSLETELSVQSIGVIASAASGKVLSPY